MPAEFTIDIDRFVAKAGARRDAFIREFTQDVAQKIVEATPVVTGFLRSSWWAQIGNTPHGRTGGNSIAQLSMTANQMKPGDVYYLSNGAVYAMRVEYGFVGQDSLGRHYNQRGRGFVRGVLNEADQIARETAARVLR